VVVSKVRRGQAGLVVLMLALTLLASGCVPGDGTYSGENPAGLLWGVWHGWIAPISLILSLFDPKFTIYESANTGFWYDFGFYIAIISGFGGLSLLRRR
jgi:hypothetical protein